MACSLDTRTFCRLSSSRSTRARRGCRRVACAPRGPASAALVVVGAGNMMSPLEPLQLQPVFEQPEELVRGGEVGCVVAADVTPAARAASASTVDATCSDLRRCGRAPVAAAARRTRRRAGRRCQRSRGRGHRRAPGTPPAGAWPGPRARNPHAHKRSRPSASARDVAPAQLGVARRRARLQQRLELPVLAQRW